MRAHATHSRLLSKQIQNESLGRPGWVGASSHDATTTADRQDRFAAAEPQAQAGRRGHCQQHADAAVDGMPVRLARPAAAPYSFAVAHQRGHRLAVARACQPASQP